MTVCGIWQGAQHLAAAIINPDGTMRPSITVRATNDNTRNLLDYLVVADIDTLILAEHSYSLISEAHSRRLRVRLVPGDLLDGIRFATAMNRRPPRNTAILLAHWPFTPARSYLRDARFTQPQKNQIPLF